MRFLCCSETICETFFVENSFTFSYGRKTLRLFAMWEIFFGASEFSFLSIGRAGRELEFIFSPFFFFLRRVADDPTCRVIFEDTPKFMRKKREEIKILLIQINKNRYFLVV